MWKLLRNLVLAAILLAGVLKLLAWYEVGQDAQRVTAELAPYAQIRYDGLSAGLDGTVSLSGVSVAIKRGATQDTYRADSVVLESPGVFWLLKHALLSDDSLPPRLGISVQGLKLPARPWLDPQLLNPVTLVPFETLGCGTVPFTAADYSRMGVSTSDARQHLDYRYDAETKLLDLTLTASVPAFANLTLGTELHPFDPKSSLALDKLHIDQLSADYTDNGYLQKRNQFCTQRASLGVNQFVEQHIAAAQALLAQHHVAPGAELVKLYRNLVEKGGRASILSLPNSNFVAAGWRDNSPEEALRQLNVTARYGDSPPVMFRLSFTAPAEPEAASLAAETPAPVPAPPPAVVASSVAAIATPAPAATATPAQMPVATPKAPPSTLAASAPVTTSAPVAPPPPATTVEPKAATMQVPTVPTTPPPHAPAANLGLQNLDLAEAKLLPPTKPPSAKTPDFQPSQPRPDEAGSTLALIWKPTLERLGEAPPEHHNYDVIEYARLKDEQGRLVRLITDGGKKLEGYVLAVDDTGVSLRIIGRDVNGDVQSVIPKARIQEIQLFHRPPPA
jgi:hypothetical protein